jgi:hypothetical protein
MRHWVPEIIGQQSLVGDALRILYEGVTSVVTGIARQLAMPGTMTSLVPGCGHPTGRAGNC